MLVRTLQNSSDKLTHHLLSWPMTQGGKTMKHVASDHLTSLGMTSSLSSLVARPYPVVKIMTSTAVKSTQQSEWQFFTANHAVRWSLLSLSKPVWGIDTSLLRQPPSLVSTYLRIRSGGFRIPSDQLGCCTKCHTSLPTLPHILWVCPHSRGAREKLWSDLHGACPHAIDYINSLVQFRLLPMP